MSRLRVYIRICCGSFWRARYWCIINHYYLTIFLHENFTRSRKWIWQGSITPKKEFSRLKRPIFKKYNFPSLERAQHKVNWWNLACVYNNTLYYTQMGTINCFFLFFLSLSLKKSTTHRQNNIWHFHWARMTREEVYRSVHRFHKRRKIDYQWARRYMKGVVYTRRFTGVFYGYISNIKILENLETYVYTNFPVAPARERQKELWKSMRQQMVVLAWLYIYTKATQFGKYMYWLAL